MQAVGRSVPLFGVARTTHHNLSHRTTPACFLRCVPHHTATPTMSSVDSSSPMDDAHEQEQQAAQAAAAATTADSPTSSPSSTPATSTSLSAADDTSGNAVGGSPASPPEDHYSRERMEAFLCVAGNTKAQKIAYLKEMEVELKKGDNYNQKYVESGWILLDDYVFYDPEEQRAAKAAAGQAAAAKAAAAAADSSLLASSPEEYFSFERIEAFLRDNGKTTSEKFVFMSSIGTLAGKVKNGDHDPLYTENVNRGWAIFEECIMPGAVLWKPNEHEQI